MLKEPANNYSAYARVFTFDPIEQAGELSRLLRENGL